MEQRHAVTQRVRHPGEKPHHLVRIGSRRVASAGRGQLPGVEGPDRQVGQHHEDGVPEEAEEKRPSARRHGSRPRARPGSRRGRSRASRRAAFRAVVGELSSSSRPRLLGLALSAPAEDYHDRNEDERHAECPERRVVGGGRPDAEHRARQCQMTHQPDHAEPRPRSCGSASAVAPPSWRAGPAST